MGCVTSRPAALFGLAVVVATIAAGCGTSSPARTAPVQVLTERRQARFVANDWWCVRFRKLQKVAAPTAECGPWDSVDVDVTFDSPEELTGPGSTFTKPLEVGSAERPRVLRIGAASHRYVYEFSYEPESVGSSSAIRIPPNTALGFAGSLWQCISVRTTAPRKLSCYRLRNRQHILPIVNALPDKHLIEVETAAPALLLSATVKGTPAGSTAYLYEFDR